MLILLVSLKQTQWKTKTVVALQWLEGMTGTKIERGEKAQADLENLSKHSQNSFIIVRVHEGFPCLLYSRQPALLSLSIFLTLSFALSLSPALLLYLCHLFITLKLSLSGLLRRFFVSPFSSLFLPQSLFLYFFSLSGSLSFPTSLSLSFLSLCLSLSHSVPFRTVAVCGQWGEVLIWPCAGAPTVLYSTQLM